MAPAATGRDLIEEVRVLLGQPRGILTLLAGAMFVTDESSIGQLGLHGPLVQCIVTRCHGLQLDISSWNVSGVTSMVSLFYGAQAFNNDMSLQVAGLHARATLAAPVGELQPYKMQIFVTYYFS